MKMFELALVLAVSAFANGELLVSRACGRGVAIHIMFNTCMLWDEGVCGRRHRIFSVVNIFLQLFKPRTAHNGCRSLYHLVLLTYLCVCVCVCMCV